MATREAQLLAQLLSQRTGLNAGSLGLNVIERAAGRISESQGKSLTELLSDCRAQPDSFHNLLAAVMVPESWFFRDRELFSELALFCRRIADTKKRPVRLLSAPCAHGEEPYSMVLALISAGLSPEQVEVVALDIVPEFIEIAKVGIYSSHAFRSDLLPWEQRFFSAVPGGLRIDPAITSRVTFKCLNLVESELEHLGRFDVIFCRNMLIYLDRPSQDLVIRKLLSILDVEGVLALTPAEAILAANHNVEPALSGRVDVFKSRRSQGAVVGAPVKLTEQERKGSPYLPEAREQVGAEEDSLELAHREANSGRVRAALDVLGRLLRAEPENAGALLMEGVLRELQGDLDSARASYRRVLYLEPNNAEGRMHLASLEQRVGNVARAHRLLYGRTLVGTDPGGSDD